MPGMGLAVGQYDNPRWSRPVKLITVINIQQLHVQAVWTSASQTCTSYPEIGDQTWSVHCEPLTSN